MRMQVDAPAMTPFEHRDGPGDADGITIGQILATLWRRRLVLFSTIFAITALGFVILKLLTPTYTSTAIVILSARQDNVVDLEQAYLQVQNSDAVTRSETDALQSRTLVDRVIDREHLMNDPEFNVYARPYEPNLLTRWGLVDYLPKAIQRYVRSKPMDPTVLSPAQLKYNVATQVLKAYDVAPDAKTYTVKLSFTSVDPEKASRIANAFVDEYMKSQIDEKVAAADRAANWISSRIKELSGNVEQADRAVEQFRETNNIIDYPSAQAEGSTLALQQVQNLAQELSSVRTTRAQLEAAYREVQQLVSNPEFVLSAPSISSAPLVENLRIQEVTAAAHLAELKGSYGERHPLVVDATNVLQKLRERLGEEARRATKQLEVQMREAQASERQLQARLDELTKIRHDENRVMPKLQRLESDQNSAKTLYDTFVTGFYRAMAQDGVPTPKGRIIQNADVVDWPTFPNIPVFLAVIFVAGVMIAVCVVYALEARDQSFRNPDALEDAVRIPVLGMTLLAPRRFRRLIRRRAPVSEEILEEPTSAMSEAIRLARTAIVLNRSDPPKVVMVTSAVPGEGKTTFALMLARLSAQAGKRVLVIEAEMRKPAFGRELSALPEKGLTEYLLGRATLKDVIGIDKASGAHFIAVREQSRFASELLGSPQMTALLQTVALSYDLVVVDTPPATIVADAFELGHVVDTAVMVVKWGSTPKHLVLDATRKLRAAGVPLSGIVMTQVDSRRYASYGIGALPYDYAKAYYGMR